MDELVTFIYEEKINGFFKRRFYGAMVKLCRNIVKLALDFRFFRQLSEGRPASVKIFLRQCFRSAVGQNKFGFTVSAFRIISIDIFFYDFFCAKYFYMLQLQSV